MECKKCNEVKLSNEFPSRGVGLSCTKPSLWCINCTLNGIHDDMCPECNSPITAAEKAQLKLALSIISQDHMFVAPEPCILAPQLKRAPSMLSKIFSKKLKEADSSDEEDDGIANDFVIVDRENTEKQLPTSSSSSSLSPSSSTTTKIKKINGIKDRVWVSVLDGSRAEVEIKNKMEISTLQSSVAKQLYIAVVQQKLMFNGMVLKAVDHAGKRMKLEDYGIQNGSKILCMRLLFTISRTVNLDHVVFNLGWTYPTKRREYLDGSCLVYEQSEFLYPINFGHRKGIVTGDALLHSGDNMGDHSGKQTINLSLKMLPAKISHLFFVLSTFELKHDLSQFKDPNVVLCRANNPEPLLTYSLKNARKCQAIIMCCLMRNTDDSNGEWSVIAIGKPALGAAGVSNYYPICSTISQLFKEGMFYENKNV